jgi:hypothetical protein
LSLYEQRRRRLLEAKQESSDRNAACESSPEAIDVVDSVLLRVKKVKERENLNIAVKDRSCREKKKVPRGCAQVPQSCELVNSILDTGNKVMRFVNNDRLRSNVSDAT